ncbi:sulfatase-like hydrolase/transferase, partial [Verrucomicrobia bacterium]|nr:sulfatase-like hydrolase/transferase [Verrucomicrobiota bacterium]
MKKKTQLGTIPTLAIYLSCSLLLLACSNPAVVNSGQPEVANSRQDTVVNSGQTGEKPNILVIIGDDMGVETLKTYGVGPTTPQTKALDSLAANGVSFDNFWSQSACSPTRATILTGRYG